MAEWRILVVDDEADIRDSVALLLETIPNAEIITAPDGAVAFGMLDTLQPHVVLSDMRMPGMNGLDLLQACRVKAPGAVRMLMTAFPDVDIAAKAVNDAHIENFFLKPFDGVDVLKRVQRAIEIAAASRHKEQALARAVDALARR